MQKLYDFIWDILCDWYIELTKSRLQAGGATALAAQQVLVYVTANTLKLLHPFMPFITEEIWTTLPHQGESLMISAWPTYDASLDFSAEEQEMERVMAVIRAIRNRRAEMNVPPSKKSSIYVETSFADTFATCAPFIAKLAGGKAVLVNEKFEEANAVSVVTADAKVFIPMGDLVDFAAERKRLQKELDTAHKNLGSVQAKLGNESFVSKAPAHVVENQRQAEKKLKETIAMLEESIQNLPC